MKHLFYSLILICTLVFISCTKEKEITPPIINVEVDGKPVTTEISIVQDSTITLKVILPDGAKSQISWKINGSVVSQDATYSFTETEPGNYTIEIIVVNADGGQSSTMLTVSVYGKYKYGTFILNEGNMTTEQGSLIFISPAGKITDSVYNKVNKSFFGNAAQDLYITNNKMYIISQNGGADGKLVIANAETLKKEAGYNNELQTLSWPTHVAVTGKDSIYIRDNNGISLFNPTTKEVKLVKGTKGANKNRMAVVGKKVFVPAGKNIYVIKGEKVDTIKMAGTVSGVIKSSDQNLWVSCTAPAQIHKINASTNAILQSNDITGSGIGAGFGATPGIGAIGDTLYFSNATTKIYRHIFSKKQTDFMTDVKEHIQNAGMVYNNLAVHPKTGEVYFNTIKGYGLDFLINDITVFNFGGTTPVLKADYKNYTNFPAGIFFTDSFN